ncbi:MAG: tRNA (adenosine(37)-N6)-threonylcarbamoyltransferase complex ATPase subunit type 1 TsaE [Chloroflexi bacterium]|nr:tRNA (adenosine(37)-N6)-threonylcarbamoyltransferase complex ATPase subunit type 1 TsaE [Chloroflexota bacterium]MCL5026582.1 tRNA (adenosine(37)-N6)-threonylcarbamoyltransferase complex ATPase subunit type 1 TsaE [Chloroflexota bacterium]
MDGTTSPASAPCSPAGEGRGPAKSQRRLLSHSPRETASVGAALGRCLQPGDILLLTGPLGAGKTCLTQGIAAGLGVEDYVKSPSFTLINEYHTAAGSPLYHIDLYRIGSPNEVHSFGLEEYLAGDGVVVVEWPERAMPSLPVEHLLIELALEGDDFRMLTFSPRGARYRALVEECLCSWP